MIASKRIAMTQRGKFHFQCNVKIPIFQGVIEQRLGGPKITCSAVRVVEAPHGRNAPERGVSCFWTIDCMSASPSEIEHRALLRLRCFLWRKLLQTVLLAIIDNHAIALQATKHG